MDTKEIELTPGEEKLAQACGVAQMIRALEEQNKKLKADNAQFRSALGALWCWIIFGTPILIYIALEGVKKC